MKVTYLSQQFLKGFSDLYQSNVMEEVGHKSGVQQVENSCRLGGRGGGRRRGREKGGGERKKGMGGGEGGRGKEGTFNWQVTTAEVTQTYHAQSLQCIGPLASRHSRPQ